MTAKNKPETTAVSAGRMSKEHFGAVNTPVYRASTILYPNLAALKANAGPYSYGRRATPTSRSFEEAINALEGGERTIAVPSGLNACATAILAVCGAGDHLLMTDSCYGPTRSFCERTLKRFGVETDFYDPLAGEGIAALFKPNTRAVFCESPGSLTFEMQDIPAIAAATHARGISVLMDNSWATPVFFRPLAHGVDLSIQAVTKYVGGHSDLLLGTITANESHAARLVDLHGHLGLYASGDDCFLALRGLRTLPTRLARHQETALKLARWLETRAEVARVLYPALESDPGHAIWQRDFNGASGLFGLVLKPVSEIALAAFVDGLEHFGIGWSWGGYESLIVPAQFKRSASAAFTAAPFKAEAPVLRIHAGLEDAGDLMADLKRGLKKTERDQVTETLTRQAFVDAVSFDEKGLIPAIAQSAATGAVLMVAWMNRETLARTLDTGEVTYWSRSRGKVWRKGETSGNHQRLVEAWVDCDGDVLLLKVDQTGPACHTGAPACFFRKLA